MPARDEPNTSQPADSISSDLGALRSMEDDQWRIGWSRQFAFIVVLVAAFVALAWFGRSGSVSSFPVVQNTGVVSATTAVPPWIAPALEQALTATLQAGEQLRLVQPPGAEAAFSQYGRPTNRGQAANWKLSAVVRGGADGASTATVDLELRPMSGEGEVFAARLTGSATAIGDLAVRSAEQLYAWLRVSAVTREQIDRAQSEIPTLAASEAYGQGIAALRADRGREALEHFQSADALEPDNPAILDGLADAWGLLGYANNSVRASHQALRAAAGLSRQRQLELEAQYAQRSEDWPRAQQVFAALKEFHPANLDYRLALAESQASQNDGEGFLASIADLRQLPDGASDDPRIDLTEAWYWYGVGDYGRCHELAREARTKAQRLGNAYALAEALVSIGRCDNNYDPAVLLEAREAFRRLDIQAREPEILRELANHEFAQGNMSVYLGYLEESVELARGMGNEPQLAVSLNSLAVAYDLHGWLRRGLELKRQTAEYQRERGNRPRYAIMLENIGVSLFKLGRYQEALAVIDEAEVAFREVDDRIGIAWLPYRRGQIKLRQGRLDEARRLMQQARANAQDRPEGNLALEATYELAMNRFYAGDYDEADRIMSDANRQYRDLGLSASIAESEITLARIDLQRHRAGDARAHLQQASDHLDDDAAYYALSIAIENANAELWSGEAEHAQACEALRSLAEAQQHAEYLLRAQIRLALCDVTAGQRSPDEALATLDAVRDTAESLGVFEAELGVDVARAVVLQRSGDEQAAAQALRLATNSSEQAEWRARPLPDQFRLLTESAY